MKAAETHRKKLLTDKMSSPHSLHGHFTGGGEAEEKESREPAELLISGDLPRRRSGGIQRYIKVREAPPSLRPVTQRRAVATILMSHMTTRS